MFNLKLNNFKVKIMDINLLNKLLKEKIRKATLYEKQQETKQAIKLWIEVSEIALNASKNPKLDIAFRTMLMNKAEQIIERIKQLKAPSTKLPVFHEEEIEPETTHIADPSANISESSVLIESSKPSDDTSIKANKYDIIDDDSLSNMPEGFKEVKPSTDFKILTPHDKEYVKKRLEEDVGMSVFQKKDNIGDLNELNDPTPNVSHPSIELDAPTDDSKVVCFACGREQPSSNKECENCGVSLKK